MAAFVPTIGADGARRARPIHWLGALLLHAALVAGVLLIRRPDRGKETIAISIVDQKREEKAKPPPPPPPTVDETPAATTPQRQPRAAPAQPLDASTPPVTNAPSIGLSLSNAGDGSLAVPAAGGDAGKPAPPAVVQKALVSSAAPAAAPGGCSEPMEKAKPKSVPQPAYAEAARAAQVQGKVRVEVTLDASGKVTAARVVAGLGYGLDEAALSAARSATFAPATQCGRAVSSTFVIGMRFTL